MGTYPVDVKIKRITTAGSSQTIFAGAARCLGFSANCTAGAAVAIFTIEILDGSNSQYFSEFEAIGVGTSEETETGTVRATDGSSAWTESTVNAIRLKGTFTARSAATNLEIDYVHLLVDYEEPEPNAGLIKLNSGLVKLNSGLIKIVG